MNNPPIDYPSVQQPHDVLLKWISEVECRDPNAMVIATSNNGELSTRTVLAKSISKEGVKFYTNYNSTKSAGLLSNSNISATFFWHQIHRQVHIRGKAVKTERSDSLNYWATRSRASQLSQYISEQSQTCPSKEHLEKLYQNAKDQFKGKDIPCPSHWGGFLIKPASWELWMGQDHRLHDRFLYSLDSSTTEDSSNKAKSINYICTRLYP